MTRTRACRAVRVARCRLSGLWLVEAKLVVISVAAVIALVRPNVVLDATGLGGLLPQWLALIWVATILACCLFTTAMIVTRRIEAASSAMLCLSLLVAANAAVTVLENGLGAVWAAAGYSVAALALYDRSQALHDRHVAGPPVVDLAGRRD
jgi:hypothetical protein